MDGNVQQQLIMAYLKRESEFDFEMNEVLAIAGVLQNGVQRVQGGSYPGKQPNINRGHEIAYEKIWDDYFADNCTYSDELFNRRFRMGKSLFLCILGRITEHNAYFQQRRDATGKIGISGLQKMIAALRMLAYGVSADFLDDYVRMGESTISKSLDEFCSSVIELFGDEYLRCPTTEDIRRLLGEAEKRGFPGMIGNVDCMHWYWDMCPIAWQGQYQGKSGKPSVVLEAVASYDLWIWHAFFGVPGSNNDINIVDCSPLLEMLIKPQMSEFEYCLRETRWKQLYLLADGIYPDWSCFVKTVSQPQTKRTQYFASRQESLRKDVERAFGVLQKRFHILRTYSRLWSVQKMSKVISCCIILHNMVIQSRRVDTARDFILDDEISQRNSCGTNHHASSFSNMFDPVQTLNTPMHGCFETFLNDMAKVKDKGESNKLKQALISHLWEKYSISN